MLIMEVARTYSAFDPDSHSGVGLNSYCPNSTCSFWGGASYDKLGNILDRHTESESRWLYDEVPALIHPRPCCYDVTVAGMANYAIEDSWCQTCAVPNGNYKYTLGYWDALQNYVFGVLTCVPDVPISDGYHKITSVLAVGREGIEFTSGVFGEPDNQPADGVYRWENRVAENRPTIYVWAITRLEIRSRYQIGANALSYHVPDVYFKTNLGEFKGDYINNQGNMAENPMSVCEDIKAYHGDLDLRSLSYTVTYADLWPYTPVDYFSDWWPPLYNFTAGQLNDSLEICDLSGLSITVTGSPPTDNMEEHGEIEGYNQVDSHFGGTSMGQPLQAQQATIVNARDRVGGSGSLDTMVGFREWCGSYTAVSDDPTYGLVPDSAVINIGGITAKKTEVTLKYECIDSADINGEYNAHLEGPGVSTYMCYQNCWYWTTCNDGWWEDATYTADVDDVCCSCASSGCFSSATAYISSNGNTRMKHGVEQHSSYISCNVAGAVFRQDFENWGDVIEDPWGFGYYATPPTPINFVGETFELPLHTVSGYAGENHDFSAATVSVTIPEIARQECLFEPQVCGAWHDKLGPEEISVVIPNNWINRPDEWRGYYSYCWGVSDTCQRKAEFRCGTSAGGVESCGWHDNGEMRCTYGTPTWLECWPPNSGPWPTNYNTLGLDWCDCCVPEGEYMLDRGYGNDSPVYDNLFSDGCSYSYYEEPGSTSTGVDSRGNPIYCATKMSLSIGSVRAEGCTITLWVYITTSHFAKFQGTIPAQPGNEILRWDASYSENRPVGGWYISTDQIAGTQLDLIGYGGADTIPYEWSGGSITLQ